MNVKNLNMILPGEEPLKSLKPVQMGINQYQVLSGRNGSVSVHLVDLNPDKPTCTCEDQQYNQQGNDVCAHIAKVMITADSTWSPEEMSMKALLNQMAEAKKATEAIRDLEGMLGRIDEANRVTGQQSGGEQSGTVDESSDVDYIEKFTELLEDSGLDPDDFEMWMAGNSLQVEQKGRLDSDDYSAWMNLVTDTYDDQIWWDGDEQRNYVTEDNLTELFG